MLLTLLVTMRIAICNSVVAYAVSNNVSNPYFPISDPKQAETQREWLDDSMQQLITNGAQ